MEHAISCRLSPGLIKLGIGSAKKSLVNERWEVVQLPLAPLTRWLVQSPRHIHTRTYLMYHYFCVMIFEKLWAFYSCLCYNVLASPFETCVVGIKSSCDSHTLSLLLIYEQLKSRAAILLFPQKIPGTRLANHGLLFMAINARYWTEEGRIFAICVR